jgi:hypothetical protein
VNVELGLNHMSGRSTLRRVAASGALAAALLLAACGPNQYGPPVEGQPLTWGQKHYLDNQRYQEMNRDRMP